MGAVGKAIGYSMDKEDNGYMSSKGMNDADIDATAGIGEMMGDESSPESTDDAEKPKAATAEVMAMKMFSKASTPEAKADALKAFLEACGAIGSSY